MSAVMPSITVETITPEIAAEWLSHNDGNRHIRHARVAAYARDMRLGRWRFTGSDAIVWNGARLLNGQHRLLACVEAATPFTTTVVRGVDEEAMSFIDIGAPRSPADALSFVGIQNHNTAAAAARLVLAYRRGILGDTRAIAETIGRDDLLDFCIGNDRLQEACRIGNSLRKVLGISGAAWAAFTFLVMDAGGGEWLDALVTGVGLDAGDPRLALRNWALNRVSSGRKPAPDRVLYTAIRAWNAYTEGRTLAKLVTWHPSMGRPVLADLL